MAHYKKDCIFCKVAQRKVEHSQFWEDRSHIAFLDKDQDSFGHSLVIPKNHVGYVFALHEKEYSALLLRAERVARALQKLTRCKRVALAIYGFSVPHTHVHLIPLSTPPRASRTARRKATSIAGKKAQKLVKQLSILLR